MRLYNIFCQKSRQKLLHLQFVECVLYQLSPPQNIEFLDYWVGRKYNKGVSKKEDAHLDKRKVIYYSDELNDEFSVTRLKDKHIGEDYVYIKKGLFKKFTHFFWYRVVAMPLAYLYTRAVFSHEIKNAEVLKPYRDTGYFIYGNHTQDIADALIPNMIDKSRDKYIVVNPANLTVKPIGHLLPSLGALPLPGNLKANRNFTSAIEERVKEGTGIVIYPEAHIWPYYTDIRPFKDTSFEYPVRLSAPVFCFTNTYHKKRHGKEPKIITYVDGPFFSNNELPPRERRAELRNRVYAKMKERAALSDVNVIEYIKKENKND